MELVSRQVDQKTDEVVERATALLRAHLQAPWTVARLSKAVGISRSPLARRFAEAFGESPMRHLARLRMDRAKELLEETDLPLGGIAPLVGYESEFALSRAFRRFHGVPPGFYRSLARTAVQTATGPVRLAA